ncbi:MAG: hypothetical protein IJA85_05350 [Clostridia bacterium]|nr:hypothetical protein [Clostridia bacterium]
MIGRHVGGITPILSLDEYEKIDARNAAAGRVLTAFRVGEHLHCCEFADITDDPLHFRCYMKNQREFCAYKPVSEYALFPGLLRQGFKMLSGGFLPHTEEADHAYMTKLLFDSVEADSQAKYHPDAEKLGDAMAKLCFILMMDMQQGESVDVMALLSQLRRRMIELFRHFRCSIRIDTVELDRNEIYPILPVLWLALLTNTAILLLHASKNSRVELQLWEENRILHADLTSDGSAELLRSIAPLELAFNRIMAERSGMGLTLTEASGRSVLCLTQKLCIGRELVLHTPMQFEEMRRNMLLAEFDRLIGL